MANIAITNRCNLRCPYCFAHEFVADERNDITPERFGAALEFITRTGSRQVGFIGGEPTLHPRFGEYLERALEHPSVSGVTVFTNGILMDPYLDLLVNPKCSLLVNWNSECIIGQDAFKRTMANMDGLMSRAPEMVHRVNLGLNLYDDAMDYRYMIDLLHHYKLTKLRISLTVPDFSRGICRVQQNGAGEVASTTERHRDALDDGTGAVPGASADDSELFDSMSYFRQRKAFLWKLFHDLDDAGILPYFDCNRPPACIWDAEERTWLEEYVQRHGMPDSSIASTLSACRPVIDIMPDLTAIRCFALSSCESASIADFTNIEELTAYFMRRIDRPAYRVFAEPACENCHLRRLWQCCQGCIGFKLPQIPAHRTAADMV